MTKNIGLAIVDYHNTSTFINGLKVLNDEYPIEILRATPTDCAIAFKNNKVDVALVPVGALDGLSDYRIITDYCIGCVGAVYSVGIFSNHELKTCTKLVLDRESRSSNKLAEIICNEFMYLNIESVKDQKDASDSDRIAYVLIGDKVFSKEDTFKYKYDLGSLWRKYTDLPFTFAVWIARSNVDPILIEAMNNCFSETVMDFDSIQDLQLTEKLSLKTYLSDYISFNLDANKLKSIEMFGEMQNKQINSF